jgi:hypothetical protein
MRVAPLVRITSADLHQILNQPASSWISAASHILSARDHIHLTIMRNTKAGSRIQPSHSHAPIRIQLYYLTPQGAPLCDTTP